MKSKKQNFMTKFLEIDLHNKKSYGKILCNEYENIICFCINLWGNRCAGKES